jgi:hypothetical protein
LAIRQRSDRFVNTFGTRAGQISNTLALEFAP